MNCGTQARFMKHETSKMTAAEYNQHFKTRTKAFALAVIRLAEVMERSISADIILKQLVRSATSIAANYRASCIARSDKERYAKLCIVVEEADETDFWLDLFTDAFPKMEPVARPLCQEAQELVRVFMAYRTKLKTHLTNLNA